MDDRRTQQRARVLRRAKIVFRQGFASVDCVVLDLSPRGARLKTGPLLGLPDEFELRIENGPVYAASVRYRFSDITGVRFTAA